MLLHLLVRGMLCLALAQAAKSQGRDVILIGRVSVPWLRERISEENIAFHEIRSELPLQESAQELVEQLGHNTGWIVLDGYHFSQECQKAIRSRGDKLLIIDDYNHQNEYHCDILLNQNLGAEKFNYRGDIGQRMLGTTYVLLRQEFIQARRIISSRDFPKKVQNILLTLGGGDFAEHLEDIKSLFMMPELCAVNLKVISGATSKSKLLSTLGDCSLKLSILSHVTDMPALMQWADLCVTAGGSTCWELCCLGVPFLPYVIAANQNEAVNHLVKEGLTVNYCRDNWMMLINNARLRTQLSNAGMRFVSGEGAIKVINCLN